MKSFSSHRPRGLAIALLLAVGVVLGFSAVASADSVGPITFESPAYATGTVNGQAGWSMTGPYDVAVATVASFPDAAGYGFGDQALRISNAVTSGAFGDQTFSPAVAPAQGGTARSHFDASFSIGTAEATQQPGLALSVSPDDGQGARMSYLRFEDQEDGVHVFFDDVTDKGPLGTVASFDEKDIATLSRTSAHSIGFSLFLKAGSATDVVKISIDGKQVAAGTTWKDYYRFDPEQSGNGNVVPTVSNLLFRVGGAAASGTSGQGFLIDDVSLASS
jgi:hypothetical protein